MPGVWHTENHVLNSVGTAHIWPTEKLKFVNIETTEERERVQPINSSACGNDKLDVSRNFPLFWQRISSDDSDRYQQTSETFSFHWSQIGDLYHRVFGSEIIHCHRLYAFLSHRLEHSVVSLEFFLTPFLINDRRWESPRTHFLSTGCSSLLVALRSGRDATPKRHQRNIPDVI